MVLGGIITSSGPTLSANRDHFTQTGCLIHAANKSGSKVPSLQESFERSLQLQVKSKASGSLIAFNILVFVPRLLMSLCFNLRKVIKFTLSFLLYVGQWGVREYLGSVCHCLLLRKPVFRKSLRQSPCGTSLCFCSGLQLKHWHFIGVVVSTVFSLGFCQTLTTLYHASNLGSSALDRMLAAHYKAGDAAH